MPYQGFKEPEFSLKLSELLIQGKTKEFDDLTNQQINYAVEYYDELRANGISHEAAIHKVATDSNRHETAVSLDIDSVIFFREE